MLTYIPITNDNINLATKIQQEIFPGESAYEHYRYTINKNEEYEKYYLVYDKDKIIREQEAKKQQQLEKQREKELKQLERQKQKEEKKQQKELEKSNN